MLDFYLKDGMIDYVKWDMNRPLTDVNSLSLTQARKGEISHRYVLGLYEILDRITKKYPKALIEGCSSGGARFSVLLAKEDFHVFTFHFARVDREIDGCVEIVDMSISGGQQQE